jgi:hypothetical protein
MMPHRTRAPLAPVSDRRRLAGTATTDDGFSLTWKDRAPVYWRLRATRARLLEIREHLGEVER